MSPAVTRVKICGITRADDARAAADLGVDALGFNFWPQSPRALTVAKAAGMVRRLPPFVSVVAVMVNPAVELVRQVLGSMRVDYLQFHGEESPDFILQFPQDKVIKALGLKDRASLAQLKKYPAVAAWLLDAADPVARGGTGRVFPWNLALAAKKKGRPVILAGGLTPLNVAQAVRKVKPWAVDTAGGVEKEKGIKDRAKMRAFIQNARTALG